MRRSWISFLFCALTTISGLSSAWGQTLLSMPTYRAVASEASDTWYILDSKWGFVSRFNLALSERLSGCDKAEGASLSALLALAPNRFGLNSAKALQALDACQPGLHSGSGAVVSQSEWLALMGAPLPTTLEKARAIAFRGAGLANDYDSAFWNADTQPSAGENARDVFTWGPARATVVDGCYIQKIVRRMTESVEGREALDRAFQEIPDGLSLLRTTRCQVARAAFTAFGADVTRRDSFRRAFNWLGAEPAARSAYDGVFLGPGGPWADRMASLYQVWAAAGRQPTEIDFAMFLELARGTPRLQPAQIAARAERLKAADPNPGAGRLAYINAMTYTNSASRSFGRGRMMSYVIDSIGEPHLAPADLMAWAEHSRNRASDVGLADTPYTPCEILPMLPSCPRGAQP